MLVLAGGAVAAWPTLFGSDGPPTAQELVERLPEPAAVTSCSQLADTAADFIEAVAAAAVEDPALQPELAAVGDGYATRQTQLGCTEADLLTAVQQQSRPGDGAAAAEIVEYFLTGVDVPYPDDSPGAIVRGESP